MNRIMLRVMFGVQAKQIRYYQLMGGIAGLMFAMTACTGPAPKSLQIKKQPTQSSQEPLTLAQKAVLATQNKPEKKDCDEIWNHFQTSPATAGSWIALISVLDLGKEMPGPCESVIRPRINEIASHPIPDSIEIQELKRNILLQMTGSNLDPMTGATIITHFRKFLDGEFFSDASSFQQRILQSYYCRKLGASLVKFEDNFLEKIPANNGYGDQCKERELRRAFVNRRI